MTWPALPIFARVAGRPVILLGDGEAADAKRRLLERAGADIVADHPEARIAIVAIEDEAAAVTAVAALRARGVLVNAVDRPALCDFTLPAIVDRAPVLLAIGTGGVSAGLAAALRQRLEGLLPAGLGTLAIALYAARDRLRKALPEPGDRRRALAAAMEPGAGLDPLGGALSVVEHAPGPSEIEVVVSAVRAVQPAAGSMAQFSLVSADPDDLTLRQARLLAQADRVLHTSSVPAVILARARADAPRILSPEPPVERVPGLTVWITMA